MSCRSAQLDRRTRKIAYSCEFGCCLGRVKYNWTRWTRMRRELEQATENIRKIVCYAYAYIELPYLFLCRIVSSVSFEATRSCSHCVWLFTYTSDRQCVYCQCAGNVLIENELVLIICIDAMNVGALREQLKRNDPFF